MCCHGRGKVAAGDGVTVGTKKASEQLQQWQHALQLVGSVALMVAMVCETSIPTCGSSCWRKAHATRTNQAANSNGKHSLIASSAVTITLWQVVLAAKTVPPHTVLLHGLRAWQTDPPPTRKAAPRGPSADCHLSYHVFKKTACLTSCCCCCTDATLRPAPAPGATSKTV